MGRARHTVDRSSGTHAVLAVFDGVQGWGSRSKHGGSDSVRRVVLVVVCAVRAVVCVVSVERAAMVLGSVGTTVLVRCCKGHRLGRSIRDLALR